MKKIFVTRDIPKAGLDRLNNSGCSVTIFQEKRALTPAELIHYCQQHEGLLNVGGNKLDSHFFTACRHLKGVALMSVGYDNVDMAAATAESIPVSNTPGVLSKATADIALLLMLAVSRKAFFMSRTIAEGQWGTFDPADKLGVELYGKTLGIFGMGRIGMELAAKCKAAFQMNIVYHNRNRNPQAAQQLGAQYVSFEELLAQSDVLSVHASLTTATREIFNAATFAQMKENSIFINTARGPLHDEKDLIAALQNKTIWGAGLDVTNPEPMLKDNPLLSMPNVCVLPHIGSATIETRSKMASMAAENVIAAVNGKPMPQVVNSDVYKS